MLNKLRTYPGLRRVIRGWLRAGVMDGQRLFSTDEGTPQGGVISPLLANIALHGLETHIRAAFRECCQRQRNWKPLVVRYADDFVVLHENEAVIVEVQQIATAWLARMGLELNPTKTQIVHTLRPQHGRRGFDFLGFWIRQHPVGKTHSGRLGRKGQESDLLGFKTIITPSPKALSRHLDDLGNVVRHLRVATQAILIAKLNPIIRGWCNYYSKVVAKDAFAKMDHLLYIQLRRWALLRHHGKTRHWIANRYWQSEQGRSWIFRDRNGPRLLDHDSTAIRRHTKVQGNKSPYDGDWVYWGTRLCEYEILPRRVAVLVRRQQGRCAWCGLFFRPEDQPEIDHVVPLKLGGHDFYSNWQLLHRHCHDRKTAKESRRTD